MLYIEADGKIRLTRGDTARFVVDIAMLDIDGNATGDSYIPTSEDTLTFTVKRSANLEEYLLQKTIKGATSFLIEPEDTKDLRFGSYVYDVELKLANGEVYTVVEESTFELKREVTW